jgi:predicted nucleotidyltransferase
MSILQKLNKKGLLAGAKPWVTTPEYEAICGSLSYGVSGDSSDMDIVSVCIPPREIIFPHLTGRVPGFGPPPESFTSWQRHHIKTEEGTVQEKEYDVTSYSIVEFFRLAADNNPNIIDALFVPDRCVAFNTDIGKVMRDNRKLFLHKGAYQKFKGYAYSQMKKIGEQKPVGKRAELVEKFGYDTKFAYHVVRLAQEAEMILMKGDLDIEAGREELKAIRRGEWTLKQLEEWFVKRTGMLDELFLKSDLQAEPNYDQLNRILMVCLEIKFGSLDNVMQDGKDVTTLRKYEEIVRIINR